MPLSRIQLPGERSRAQELYEFLRNAILDGTLEPNERLVEESIAALASVSRTPVREALRKLEADNLVRDTGQGIVVGTTSPEELEELCAVRETLEGMASRLAARLRSELEVASLRRILEEYREATQQRDVERLVVLNHAFHEAIWQAARNRYLFRELTNLRDLIERLQKTTLDRPERQRAALPEHEALFEAIVRQDEDEAERLARLHFREAMAIRLMMARLAQKRV
ncbi:GntR family transcriptional regulator [Thermogemmatispora carboxidivorans]|uniref:GntR family transcriptional regulator n=1 Tax=Thermogemmatispora carboxidivorans TaxID=1382306 RepID=UPI00069B34B0|nr:GntR family transcriptional regulator [Thermogemmatispora carboxidivorans]